MINNAVSVIFAIKRASAKSKDDELKNVLETSNARTTWLAPIRNVSDMAESSMGSCQTTLLPAKEPSSIGLNSCMERKCQSQDASRLLFCNQRMMNPSGSIPTSALVLPTNAYISHIHQCNRTSLLDASAASHLTVPAIAPRCILRNIRSTCSSC